MSKVRNMDGNSGKVANQFIISEEGRGANGNFTLRETFQSYDSVIATITIWPDSEAVVVLDEDYWDYSVTVGKYRNQFLREKKAVTKKKIESGEYRLANLNKG